jgi:integrase/recombinase XerD
MENNVITNAEFDTLLKSADNPKHKLILLLMHDAGLRVTEACRVRWEDCDFRHRQIKVKSLKKRKDAKPRVLPMSSRLYFAFTEYATKTGKQEGYVFPGKDGTHQKRGAVNMLLTRLERSTPEVVEVHPHKLRHSFATNLRARGADLADIADTLGHEKIETTRIYAHADTAKLRLLMEAPKAKPTLKERVLSALKPRGTRPISLVVPDPKLLVGRSAEVQQIERAVQKGINVVLTGPIGSGKSHLLQNLQFLQPTLELDSCGGLKTSLANAIVHLVGTKEKAIQLMYNTTDPEQLRTKVSKESVQNLVQVLCSLTKPKEYILLIGHADDVTPTSSRALEQLKAHFTIVTSARKINPTTSAWAWDFERIQVKPLGREDTVRLFHRLTGTLEFRNREYIQQKVWDTSEGNPRIITELAERLGKEENVTPEITDEIASNYIGYQVKEMDMSLVLLIALGGFAVLRYVGRANGDKDLQMIGGMVMVVLLFARYFFNGTKRRAI